MTDRFRYYLRVRFCECDPQKVVFNARYGDYVDVAVSEFMRALGYGEEMKNGELDYQCVKQTIEWRSPGRFDQVLEVAVAASHLGRTSFAVDCEFRIAGEAKIIAKIETYYVLVDSATLTKRELPHELREALKAGAPGRRTDHAAYLADGQ